MLLLRVLSQVLFRLIQEISFNSVCRQFSYLLGTQPDVVVLCINPFDDLDYIMRTKLFIEASVDCKVIAFVMFPMDIKDDWTGIYGQKVR